ncbi:hypothetical protein BH93_02335 [Rhodococcoides fascians A25f]|uniref:WhiB family transcriptional regulator n=1 Tax=Rhodococcoides fascians TaxID=1828 RepID=UPI00055E19E9|nr:WhiB family transcriptional regulator [Rhodococcus fascians]QII04353.1 hypothetical protein BH93_02335 [Rhodococcus fascians A25f]
MTYSKTPEAAKILKSPTLRDAACHGRWPMFDAEIDGEKAAAATIRLDAAVQLCATCPVHAACESARQALPVREVAGVWAGRVYGRPTRKAA